MLTEIIENTIGLVPDGDVGDANLGVDLSSFLGDGLALGVTRVTAHLSGVVELVPASWPRAARFCG